MTSQSSRSAGEVFDAFPWEPGRRARTPTPLTPAEVFFESFPWERGAPERRRKRLRREPSREER